jgi:hypothetical protein
MVGITPELLRRYEMHFGAWSEEIASACRARHAQYVRVSTAVPPQRLILQTLRHDGLLR